MADYGYSQPYRGMSGGALPPDFLHTATAPGRNLAAGIASFGKDIGDAIKQHSDDAKATKAMRSLVGIYQPDMKDQAESMSKDQLEGMIKGFVMKQDAEERKAEAERRAKLFPIQQQAAQLQVDQGQTALGETQRQAKAAAAFNQSIARSGRPDPVASAAGAMADPRSGVTLSSLGQFVGENPVVPKLTPDLIMRLAAASGALTPELAGNLSQFAVKPDGRHQFTADQMGKPTPVPGIPGKFYVPTSTGGGQLVDSGSAASGKWQEQFLPDGSPTGWAIASDGSMRRLRDKRDVVGAEQYDLDGDGIISQEEFQQAVIAEKFGGVYPGMRVGQGKNLDGSVVDQPTSPGEAYKKWKESR